MSTRPPILPPREGTDPEAWGNAFKDHYVNPVDGSPAFPPEDLIEYLRAFKNRIDGLEPEPFEQPVVSATDGPPPELQADPTIDPPPAAASVLVARANGEL